MRVLPFVVYCIQRHIGFGRCWVYLPRSKRCLSVLPLFIISDISVYLLSFYPSIRNSYRPWLSAMLAKIDDGSHSILIFHACLLLFSGIKMPGIVAFTGRVWYNMVALIAPLAVRLMGSLVGVGSTGGRFFYNKSVFSILNMSG